MNKEKKSFFKTALRVITIQFNAAPWHTIANVFLGATHALLLTAGVIATQLLFDAITQAADGKAGFWECVMPLLFLAGAKFGHQIIKGINNLHDGILADISIGRNRELLHRKLQRVDPVLFEDTVFLDYLDKAQEGIKAIAYFCMTIFTLVGLYGVYIASISVYLFKLKPMLLLILLIAYFPAMLAQIVRGKVFTNLEELSAPLRRKCEYYQKTLCNREYFKETRILGAYQYFQKLFLDTMNLLIGKTWQAERKTVLLVLLLNMATFAGMAVAVFILFMATMAGEISIGAFAAVLGALNAVFSTIWEIVNVHMGTISENIGKIVNLLYIIDMPEKSCIEGTIDLSKGIVAKNISFTYPGRDKPTIKEVSLTIPDGETIAIVGENGAGKSTLVRLLTGIYRPSEGNVTVGGLDTAEVAMNSIYRGISGVFQKYQRYKMTLEENVIISNTEIPRDTTRMEAVLEEANFNGHIAYDTMLSPEFHGIDLSGGQWQRLAIARGLYRVNGFIVLDEPTAAIDPMEEARIYTQFQHLIEGKCGIIVTHRLGSAKLSNHIIVMDAGEIVDAGTHEELLAHQGKYAEMWTAQAKWYERGDIECGDKLAT